MIAMDPEPTGWDIVSGVGITALGAAAMRAMEGHHAEPLVRDPYAAAFVRAAADQLPAPMPVTPEEAAADPDFPWPGMGHYVAVRSPGEPRAVVVAGRCSPWWRLSTPEARVLP